MWKSGNMQISLYLTHIYLNLKCGSVLALKFGNESKRGVQSVLMRSKPYIYVKFEIQDGGRLTNSHIDSYLHISTLPHHQG